MGKYGVPSAELAGGIADNPNTGTTGTPPGGPSISAETISVHASGGRFRFDAHVFSHVRILADKLTGSATSVTLAWCATPSGTYTTVLTFTLGSDPASASVVLPLSVMGDVYWSLTADDGATTWKMFAAQFLPLAGTRIIACSAPFQPSVLTSFSDSLCSYNSLADLDASPLYTTVFHNNFGDPILIGYGGTSPPPALVTGGVVWNGLQAFEMVGIAGTMFDDGSGTGGVGFLEVDGNTPGVSEFWVRYVAMFSSGYFSFTPDVYSSGGSDRAGSDTFLLLALGGAQLYYDAHYDFGTSTWSRFLHVPTPTDYIGDIVYSGEPTFLATGALVEIIAHVKDGNVFFYAQPASGGTIHTLGARAGADGTYEAGSGPTVYGAGDPAGDPCPSRTHRWCGLEFDSGADPFGLLATGIVEPSNLLVNSSFESDTIGADPASWIVHKTGTGAADVTMHVVGATPNANSFDMRGGDLTQRVQQVSTTYADPFHAYIEQTVTGLTPSTAYTLSVSMGVDWSALGATTGGAHGIGARPYIRENLTGAIGTMDTVVNEVTLGHDGFMQRVTVTFTTGSSQTTAVVQVGREFITPGSIPPGDYPLKVWIDAVQLEKGSTAGGYLRT